MELLGKGFHHRAGKAIQANIIAAVTSVVFIAEVRVGLVRRVRFGDSCEAAVGSVFKDLPKCSAHRLLVVDAGIATHKQFAAASDKDALLGRLRINGKLRCAPPPRPEQPGPGRPPKHGDILHLNETEDPNLDFPSEDIRQEFTFDLGQIEAGDEITIQGTSNEAEFVRIDFVTLTLGESFLI
ncbi:MAG: hypothetical protein QNJ72_24260 [Pleurocapsa sp. MO_226.B13]|nr:hypothetical protein [Pleurocapsa sp. MO_226.B13]